MSLNKPYKRGIYIKPFLLLVLLLVVGVLTLVSCKQPPASIRMLDINKITHINYSVTTSKENFLVNESLIHLSKSNAGDTEIFMLLKHIIQSYENEIFNLAKNKDNFTNDLELKSTDLSINFESFDNDKSIRSYTLNINMMDMTGILNGPEHTYDMDTDVLMTLLNSDLIPVDTITTSLPIVTLSYNDEQTDLQSVGSWNNLLYLNRYQEESVSKMTSSNKIDISGTQDSNLSLNFETTIPDQLIINIFETSPKGKLVSSDTLFPTTNHLDINIPDINNSYYVEAMCHWKTREGKSFGTMTYSFLVNVEISETFSLSKESYQPGDLLVLKGDFIDDDLNYTIESDIYNQGLTFQSSGKSYYLFLPIMSKADLGTYTITIIDNDHPEQKSVLDVDVVYKEFDIQYLETSGSTATLQNDDNYAQLNEAFARGRENLHSEHLWDGVFIQPVGGRISTEYGQIRYTNGSENSSRHSGIDFANPTGTEIVATQNGYVTLAEALNITGNTLFIDHGFGIISQYYHTNKIYVSVGDYVTAGQPVAEVGTTGFSTGPHLHFTIYNNGIYLNPWKFFEAAPF